MTDQNDCTLPTEFLEQIAEQGLAVLPELIATVVNTAMQLERQRHLGAAPYERSEGRRGQANGYKAKTVATRVGRLPMAWNRKHTRLVIIFSCPIFRLKTNMLKRFSGISPTGA